jgi:hypothetical protein
VGDIVALFGQELVTLVILVPLCGGQQIDRT